LGAMIKVNDMDIRPIESEEVEFLFL